MQIEGMKEGGALKGPVFGKCDEVEFAGWWWHWRVRACLWSVGREEGGREGGGNSADGEEWKQERRGRKERGNRASRPACVVV